ncbi:lipopolysaccharide biosynthesis protein [Aquimarina muelleri]|uniref:Polyhydroxyalkanoate synthase n=1 Tax=Aquimarina muelleri TaxID=279356 RepID=A0A918JXY7_9FLAO|nr:oligosaccharide flippase family protein [Aquimarina muelleri]MCX2764196.1 oligosaccharide flippase family protein [Aquimarina muelleri]GGX19528.1 polyhydroxyalkanoate synthase [Aquimarina muelleri]
MKFNLRKIALKSEFLKNVATVMTGTTISLVISLVLTPVLTRNYSPEDFGFLLVYTSILMIFGTFSTGKFERVILLLESEKHINKIVFLSSLTSVIAGILLLAILFFGKTFFINKLSLDITLYHWLYSLPILLIFYSYYTVFMVISNYRREYKQLSITRIIRTLLSITFNIIFIFYFGDARGLVLGEFLGYFSATIYIVYVNRNFLIFERGIIQKSKELALKYKEFPIYNIPSDFINMGSSQMPAFFLTNYFGANVTGFYSLMKRTLDAPIVLFSNSVLEVFRQKAAEHYIKKGNCKELFVKTAGSLSLLSILPFTILFFYAPELFSFVFGDGWTTAGEYARIFSIYYYFKFISSPLSYMFYIAEKQKQDFLLHIYVFCSTLIILVLPEFFSLSDKVILWIYCVNFILIYFTYFIISLKLSLGPNKKEA